MCEAIARSGNGASVFVGETEKPDQKLMGLLRAASGPPVENLTIDWGITESDKSVKDDDSSEEFELISESDITLDEASETPMSFFDDNTVAAPQTGPTGPTEETLPPVPTIQQAPTGPVLPPIYPGFRAELFAIVKRANNGNSAPSRSVRITGTVLGVPIQLDIPVQSVARQQPADIYFPLKMIHLLAARALIQTFEDKNPVTHTDKAQILRLALRYSLASSQSSFVAVDQTTHVVYDDYGDYSYGQPAQATLRPYQPRTVCTTIHPPCDNDLCSVKQMQSLLQQPSAFSPPQMTAMSIAPPSPLQFPPARISTESHPSIERYLAGPETMSPISPASPSSVSRSFRRKKS